MFLLKSKSKHFLRYHFEYFCSIMRRLDDDPQNTYSKGCFDRGQMALLVADERIAPYWISGLTSYQKSIFKKFVSIPLDFGISLILILGC